MSVDEEIKEFVAKRDRALREMDIDYARKMLPKASSEHVRLAAMHKARLEVIDMEDSFKEASLKWLSDNGFHPMYYLENQK